MSYQRTQSFQSRRRPLGSGGWNRNQNTVAFVSSIQLGPIAHTVLIALMVTVLGLVYLTQATRASGFDYEAKQINDQISDLATKKSDLEVENARLTALEAVKTSTVASAMTVPASTEYVH